MKTLTKSNAPSCDQTERIRELEDEVISLRALVRHQKAEIWRWVELCWKPMTPAKLFKVIREKFWQLWKQGADTETTENDTAEKVNIFLTIQLCEKACRLARKLDCSLSELIERLLDTECGIEFGSVDGPAGSPWLMRLIEGRIYCLSSSVPVGESDGAWAHSTTRKAIVVRAESEKNARQYAAIQTSKGADSPWQNSPWLNPALATCEVLSMRSTGEAGIIWNDSIWIGSREGESA
jgi:macrodomain Ter protein organizer (MatP/YcbG family)